MKKRILAILAIVALLVTLVVPAFAATSESVTISGVWRLNGMTGTTSSGHKNQTVNFTYNGEDFTKMTLFVGGGYQFSRADGTFIKFWSTDADKYEYPQLINFGTVPQPVDDVWFNYFSLFAEPVTCDGSVCPVDDLNGDKYCDDCGALMAVYALRTPMTLPDFVGDYPGYGYFVVQEEGGYRLYLPTSSAEVTYNTETNTFSSTSYLQLYYAEDGATTWRYLGQHSNVENISMIGKSFYDSNIDIKDEDGDLFFPPRLPLWMEVGETVKVEMTTLPATLTRTVLVLVLCGVGCLACLVVLKILPMLLYRYL